MKETPLLFKSEMTRAILGGCKTQTRRVIKFKHGNGDACHPAVAIIQHLQNDVYFCNAPQEVLNRYISTFPNGNFRCPLGQVGDIVWAKETWRTSESLDSLKPSQIRPGAIIEYAAGGNSLGEKEVFGMSKKWRSPLFMMRWMSRIVRPLESIRAERLQDISEADAIAEGCRDDEDPYWRPSYSDPDSGGNPSAKLTYEWLWESINGPGSWAKNPFVWVYKFRKL